jgi:hypothetical protein
MGTGVVERVELSARIRDIHPGPRDLEDAHLSRGDIGRATDSDELRRYREVIVV